MKITTAELLLRYLVGEGAAGYRIARAVPTVIDVHIDPTEVPPIDRWVHSVGELRARLDAL